MNIQRLVYLTGAEAICDEIFERWCSFKDTEEYYDLIAIDFSRLYHFLETHKFSSKKVYVLDIDLETTEEDTESIDYQLILNFSVSDRRSCTDYSEVPISVPYEDITALIIEEIINEEQYHDRFKELIVKGINNYIKNN